MPGLDRRHGGSVPKTFTDYLDDTHKSYGDYKTIKEQQGVGAADWAHAQTLTGVILCRKERCVGILT